jgi:hypothetical protein
LAIHEQFHGPDHPNITTTLINLAHVLQDLGKGERAAELRARAAVQDRRHPLTGKP